MRPEELIERWRTQLSKPLPGRAAQALMAPDLSYGRHSDPPAWDARPAAVVALLYFQDEEWRLPLTVRPPHLSAHAGQICLPGGAIHAGESVEQAALRELREEIGVAAEAVQLVGRLSPINLFVSNFHVSPCVAVAEHRPTFVLEPGEVTEVIELPLNLLLDPAARKHDCIPGRRIPLSAPYYDYKHHRIWGATAMMLSELAAVWGEVMSDE